MTQTALGAALGVGQAAVSRWEKGKTQPEAAMLPLIALSVGGSMDQLVEGIAVQYDARSHAAGRSREDESMLQPTASKEMDAKALSARVRTLEREIAEAEERRKRYESAMGDVKTVVQQLLAMADLASQDRVDVAVDAVMSEAQVKEQRARDLKEKRKRKKSKHAKANVRRMRS